MRHVLFPISVDNTVFSTENTLGAISELLSDFDKITFLIADRIQVYNDIAKREGDLTGILSLDWSGSYRRDFAERRRWLHKLRDRLPRSRGQIWRIMGVDDAVDRHAYVALRSVWLLYKFDRDFSADINATAKEFCARHQTQSSLLYDMSLAYLVEEIAINIRLRVMRGIFDEFYMGATLGILPRLYDGHYSKTAEELMGRHARAPGTFRFWSWYGQSWQLWDTGPKRHLRLVSDR
jgi:hypothetical protein